MHKPGTVQVMWDDGLPGTAVVVLSWAFIQKYCRNALRSPHAEYVVVKFGGCKFNVKRRA